MVLRGLCRRCLKCQGSHINKIYAKICVRIECQIEADDKNSIERQIFAIITNTSKVILVLFSLLVFCFLLLSRVMLKKQQSQALNYAYTVAKLAFPVKYQATNSSHHIFLMPTVSFNMTTELQTLSDYTVRFPFLIPLILSSVCKSRDIDSLRILKQHLILSLFLSLRRHITYSFF